MQHRPHVYPIAPHVAHTVVAALCNLYFPRSTSPVVRTRGWFIHAFPGPLP